MVEACHRKSSDIVIVEGTVKHEREKVRSLKATAGFVIGLHIFLFDSVKFIARKICSTCFPGNI